jgi:hypothetical protein
VLAPHGDQGSRVQCGLTSLQESPQQGRQLFSPEALGAETDYRGLGAAGEGHVAMKVCVERYDRSILGSCSKEDFLVLCPAQTHFPGVDAVHSPASQKVSCGPREALVEEDPQRDAGKSRASSSRFAAAYARACRISSSSSSGYSRFSSAQSE